MYRIVLQLVKVDVFFSMLGNFQASTNPPSVQQHQGMMWAGEGANEGVFQPPPALRQADTLDTNPLMVNPLEVQQQQHSAVVSQAEGQQHAQQQQIIQTNPDGTFVIPLSQTQSGTEFFRTESGSQYSIVETTPAVKQV